MFYVLMVTMSNSQTPTC